MQLSWESAHAACMETGCGGTWVPGEVVNLLKQLLLAGADQGDLGLQDLQS